jgi:mannose-6-phosphate isomerase-like protein (cupin superfamily)
MISIATAEHYHWGEQCDGWHLVRSAGLSVIYERMPPGTAEQRHVHGQARQFFFVISGVLVIEIDGHEEQLAEQQGVELAPGQPHQVFNRSQAPAEFLVISQPPARGDRQPVP